jgi:glycosyltransferase involved in cell wall biosynthesis
MHYNRDIMAERSVKVAYVIDDLGRGGAQRQLSLLAPALAARARGAVVFCMSSITAPFADVIRAGGVEVRAFERRSSMDLVRLALLRRGIRDEGADVVHSFLDASNVYAYAAARSLRLPVVLSLRSDRLSLKGVRGRVLRTMLRNAEAVVANSEAGHRALVSQIGVDQARALLVRNCVDVESYEAGERGDSPVVGFVGRLVASKGVDRLVESFADADVRGSSLVVVGGGPESERLEALVRERGLVDRVTFAGAVDDVRPWLHRFTCLVLPSEYEGLPNALLEALAAGVPVVAPPVGDVASIVEDGRTGILVAEGAALPAAIVRALRDTDLQRSARAEGPAFVRENFSVDRAADALLYCYHRLVSAGR